MNPKFVNHIIELVEDIVGEAVYLTGSVYFMGHGHDIDVMARNSLAIQNKLLAGSAMIIRGAYPADKLDTLTAKVYRIYLIPTFWVDVQLVHNIEHKLNAQQFIRRFLAAGNLYPRKPYDRNLWQFAINQTK